MSSRHAKTPGQPGTTGHPGPTGDPESSEDPGTTALIAALIEVERHIGGSGWDQPARLFALVGTDRLLAAEPGLADRLRRLDADPFALTAVEQEHFLSSSDLIADLAQVSWPDSVDGCAIAVERLFLPPAAEDDLPDDPAAAADVVAAHPQRQEVRVVVGVDRAGRRHGVARLRSQPNELLGGVDLVPGLAEVVAHTLT